MTLPWILAASLVANAGAIAIDAPTSGRRMISLTEAVQAASLHDPQYAADRFRDQADADKIPEARSLFLPQISANANSSYNEATLQFMGPSLFPGGQFNYNAHGYGIFLTQPLFNARSLSLYRQAKVETTIARDRQRQADADLILRTSQAYVQVLLAQDRIRYLRSERHSIRAQLNSARRRFALGTATVIDVDEAKAHYDATAAANIAAVNDMALARARLTELTGLHFVRPMPIQDHILPMPPGPGSLDRWLHRALRYNPEIDLGRRGSAVRQLIEQQHRDARLPTLNLVGSYARAWQGPPYGGFFGNNETMNRTIGVELDVPLFEGGRRRAQLQSAVHRREQAQAEADQIRERTLLDVRTRFLSLVNGAAQIAALRQAVTSSDTSLISNRLGFHSGLGTSLDVLTAEQQYERERQHLALARYAYLLNWLKLQADTGMLTLTRLSELTHDP